MKKILYISYDGMTDPLGQSQVLPYLSGLSKLGYNITLLSCEKAENYHSRKESIQSIVEESNISWVPLSYTKKPPILSTLLDVLRLEKKALALHRAAQFDIVHCRSYIAALIGLRMKKKYGCRFIFDMRGFWADERVDGNLWKLSNPVYKSVYNYFKAREKDFIQKADHIISLTENARNEIHSWSFISGNPVKIKVIPCCVDTELFSDKAIPDGVREQLRNSLGINSGDFILLYLGAIGTWYMLDEMLDFFQELLSDNPKAKFLFVTAEPADTIYQKARSRNIGEESIIVRRAERKEVPAYISISTASIFFIKPAYSKKASSPTKQGELMSMGLPVICNSGVGDTDYVVDKYKSGWLVDDFQKKSYQEVLKLITSENQPDPRAIRQGALNFFSLEQGIKNYSEVYESVLAQS
jgi:glycosyltransferase involved in cell wall biosynthesis